MLRRRDFLAAAPASLAAGISGLQTPLFAAPTQPARSQSCILILLVGGPSQIDTWDPKPNAPSDIRSPWRAIKTNVPGIELTELFPRMAREADKYTLVRSMYHDGAAFHEVGQQLVQTGFCAIDGTQSQHVGCSPAGHLVLPFRIGNTGGGEIANGQSATDVLDRLDLSGEPLALRNDYGRNGFGQSCLMARRLVERGTRFVTINMFRTVFHETTWDAHGSQPFSSLAAHRDHAAPLFDRAYSALLRDLASRGLLASTLVVATGEFGRTPRLNPAGGRDHWPGCWTAVLAGGGVPGGEVYGSSDRHSAEPKDSPVHASRLAATMAHRVGNQIPGIKPLFA